jgi:hypothetical protein
LLTPAPSFKPTVKVVTDNAFFAQQTNIIIVAAAAGGATDRRCVRVPGCGAE